MHYVPTGRHSVIISLFTQVALSAPRGPCRCHRRTERQQAYIALLTAARRLRKTIKATPEDQKALIAAQKDFRDAVKSIDPDTKAGIYKFLAGSERTTFFSHGFEFINILQKPDEVIARLDKLIGIHPEILFDPTVMPSTGYARLADPDLALLVRQVAPIWTELTGRSLQRVAFDTAHDDRRHYFAEWLNGIFEDLGLSETPEGRIADVVATYKSAETRQ